MPLLEGDVLTLLLFHPLSLCTSLIPSEGLPPRFPLRPEAGIIAPLGESAWNCPQQVFPGWVHIPGGSTAQQTDPMPGPILNFWKVPLSCPHPEIQKDGKGGAPTWGVGQGEDLGCSPVPDALISWDERAWCFLCPRQVQDGEPGDRGIGHLTAGVVNFQGKTIVGAEKSTPFPSIVAED